MESANHVGVRSWSQDEPAATPAGIDTPGSGPEIAPLVCIVDDEEPVRRSLARLLRSADLPTRTFSSAAEFLDTPPHPGPCCLILDVKMPGGGGFEVHEALRATTLQVVFLTGHGDVAMCRRALKAGAADFLTKPVDDEILLEAVSSSLKRSRLAVAAKAEQLAACARLARLTPRESAVMDRVIAGMLNKQIAADLGIAEKTIKVHRGRMMRKTGTISVPDLVRLDLASRSAAGVVRSVLA